MKVLCTGATGYVGSRVVEKLLGHGHTVTGITNRKSAIESLQAKGVNPILGNLKATNDLIELAQGHEAIVHTAFQADDVSFNEALEVEAQFLKSLLPTLAGSGKTLILSNGTVFLGDSGSHFLDESAPVQQDHPGATRAWVEQLALKGNEQGLRVVSIRLAKVCLWRGRIELHTSSRPGSTSDRRIDLHKRRQCVYFGGAC